MTLELDGSEDDCEKQRPEDKEQVSGRKSQSLRDEHNDAGRLLKRSRDGGAGAVGGV